jgi:hypothetical protein
VQSHYAVTSTIRYYKPSQNIDLVPGSPPRLRVTFVETSGEAPFDFSRWKDAPHVALANLRDDPEAVLRFVRVYGWFDQRTYVPVREVLDCRDYLRQAWEGGVILFMLPKAGNIFLSATPTGKHLAVYELWSLIQILFARDWEEKRIKKCGNPDCPAPYFCAVRQGQKFCSQKCAVLINVRHFREREAALKAKGGK